MNTHRNSRRNSLRALGLVLAGTALLPAQLAIPSYTIDGGGGTSASSGGTFTLAGTVGQPDAHHSTDPGTLALDGGFWTHLAIVAGPGYADWAATNIPVGFDASFAGDANGDGVPNGIVYVFGESGVEIFGPGMLSAPPDPLPADVGLTLFYSNDLQNWLELLSGFTIEDGVLTDSTPDPNRFYQYEATLLP